MSTRKKWTMPGWMEPFRGSICNTGGNEIEELVNDHDTTVEINVARAMLCVAVKSQVSLLTRLHERGHLSDSGQPVGR